MSTKKNVVVICGGDGSEYEVSLKSGKNIFEAIDSELFNKYFMVLKGRDWKVIANEKEYQVDKNNFSCTIDGETIIFHFAYITIHGVPGENGVLQGYLDMMGVPYSTSNVRVEAITFDKYTCTTYLRGMGIETTNPVLLRKGEGYSIDEIIDTVGLPCFVKPSGEGSSFGVTKVKTVEALQPALELAFSKCSDVVIESFIDGTEFTCGVYKFGNKKVVFPIAEVVPKNEFFDYEAKYTTGMTDEIIPGRFTEEIAEEIQTMASNVYDILGCSGIIRVDGFVSNGKVIMLEVNTTPGMTANSFVPQMVRAMGTTLTQVLTNIIQDKLN